MSTALPSHLIAPPGDVLDEWLDERSMSQRELADRMGKSEKFVSQLITGKASLTPSTAHDLELVSGISAPAWLRMEADYRAALKRDEVVAATQEASPFEAALIRVLREIGVVTAPRGDRGAQAVDVFRFLGVASSRGLENLAARHATALRTSAAYAPDPIATEVAIALTRAQAEHIDTEPYDEVGLRDAVTTLRALTALGPSDGARQAREVLRRVGVALVFIPSIPKSHCNGLTLWEGGRAIIGISDRGKREDIFWFTVFHELSHVLHDDRDAIYLEGGDRDGRHEAEERADAFATTTLVPASEAWRLAEIDSLADLDRVAKHLGIGPGVILGRLQHEGLKPHSWGANRLRRVEVRASPSD